VRIKVVYSNEASDYRETPVVDGYLEGVVLVAFNNHLHVDDVVDRDDSSVKPFVLRADQFTVERDQAAELKEPDNDSQMPDDHTQVNYFQPFESCGQHYCLYDMECQAQCLELK
jgi:hypothetical protein